MTDLFTLVATPAVGVARDAEETWRKFGLPAYEMGFVQYCNPLMTAANTEVQEKRMKNMFIVAFSIVPSETTLPSRRICGAYALIICPSTRVPFVLPRSMMNRLPGAGDSMACWRDTLEYGESLGVTLT